MCTAATYQTKDFYMGRTLDYEFSYGEQIAIVPRNYPIKFHYAGILEHHYACIGMAHVANGYPLYYDAANEKGLGMAGLNFVGNAAYVDVDNEKENVAQYEFIPWILTQCATVEDAKKKLKEILIDLKNDGLTILTVTHDVEFAAENADRCALFFDGEIRSAAVPEKFFSENNFYTTAANRMARNVWKNAVTVAQVISCAEKSRGICK